MSRTDRVVLGLGSNLGDRMANLAAAVEALSRADGLTVHAVSTVVESEPWGDTAQPRFANAAALVSFDGEADRLLEVCQAVEDAMGRVRDSRWGPRVIDVDILLFGDEEWSSAQLTVPHPRLCERAFALLPTLEVLPDAALPSGVRPDPAAAVEGAIVRVLGPLPGWERAGGLADDEPWVPVGPVRLETGAGSLAALDLLPLEAELVARGIPVVFAPHRPGEGHLPYPVPVEITMMVPASHAARAAELLEGA